MVFIHLDPKSERIVASMRLHRHVSRDLPSYRVNQSVELLISGVTPLGYNAIVEKSHRGLLFRDNTTSQIKIGQRLQGFVRNVRANGQIDLSLDATGYKRVAPLTVQIVQALKSNGGKLAFDDGSSPEAIREKFGVSKNAFKQALGKRKSP